VTNGKPLSGPLTALTKFLYEH